jgi:hypothetical protein
MPGSHVVQHKEKTVLSKMLLPLFTERPESLVAKAGNLQNSCLGAFSQENKMDNYFLCASTSLELLVIPVSLGINTECKKAVYQLR